MRNRSIVLDGQLELNTFPERHWAPLHYCTHSILVLLAADSMEDEICYADLNLPSEPRCTVLQQPVHISNISKRFIRYKISLGILGAICSILGSAVIVLIIFVFQNGFPKGDAEAINADKDVAERLKELQRIEISPCSSESIAIHLCAPSTENATCKLCPANWKEEKGTCYWFSKEKYNWSSSYNDCSRKRAQMLVIQDREELKFIYDDVQEKYPVWIGLNFTPSMKSWTWVDGTALNQALIQLHPEKSEACAVIKTKARSEMCTVSFRWICEKRAIFV